MSSSTTVATANVLCTLDHHDAERALHAVLEEAPDLVGLQEWGLRRRNLLRAAPQYVWVVPPYGGNPVGARSDRFRLLSSGIRALGWLALSDPGARPVPVLPPRAATVAVFHDRELSRTVSLVNFHLVPGVQSRGAYRADRPRLVARHRHEVRRLASLVGREQQRSQTVYATGDSNFHGLRLPGLDSAWTGRETWPGTLGSDRKIDDVFGPGPAGSVRLVTTASDHKAAVASRPDRCG